MGKEGTRMALLSVENLGKNFGEKVIFDHVSFELKSGECLFLSGSSGSGKTTLLRCICLLERASRGEIVLDGQNITNLNKNVEIGKIRRKIGFVFQNLSLWEHLTVLENVSLPIRLQKQLSRADTNLKANSILESLDISDKANEYPVRLSGGQRQRLAIARALTTTPDILMLDEVFSNLDAGNSKNVIEIIYELLQENMSIILVSHNQSVLPSDLIANKLNL